MWPDAKMMDRAMQVQRFYPVELGLLKMKLVGLDGVMAHLEL